MRVRRGIWRRRVGVVSAVVVALTVTAGASVGAPATAATAHCFVPEASMSNLGGSLPGEKQIQGYGYIVCDHIDPALVITGVLTADTTQSEVFQGINAGYGNASAGGNACANAYLCLMKTQVATGYGVRVCYSLTNVGAASNPSDKGSKNGYDCF